MKDIILTCLAGNASDQEFVANVNNRISESETIKSSTRNLMETPSVGEAYKTSERNVKKRIVKGEVRDMFEAIQ